MSNNVDNANETQAGPTLEDIMGGRIGDFSRNAFRSIIVRAWRNKQGKVIIAVRLDTTWHEFELEGNLCLPMKDGRRIIR